MPFAFNANDHEWPEAVGKDGPFGGFGPTIMAIIWAEFALATLLLLMRLYTRHFIQQSAGWALSWTGFSWIIGLIAQIIFTVAVQRSDAGFSTSWTVPQALTLSWVSIYLTFIAIGIGKFAVVAFILSLQGMTHLRQRYFLYFLAVSNIIIDVVFVLFLAFRCSPPSHMFVMGLSQSCHMNFAAGKNFGYFTGSWNAATDLILAIYPIYLFHNIHIDRSIKIGICFVMGLGMVAFATAVVKTWDISYINTTDMLTYQLYCILTWSFTEMWVVLMTCSIPPLWPLAKRALAGSRSTFKSMKGWAGSNYSSPAGSEPSRGWSVHKNRRNTMTLLGNGKDGAYSSRSRSDSDDKDVELLNHPQVQARSTSRAVAQGGRQTPTRQQDEDRKATHARSKSSKSGPAGKNGTDITTSIVEEEDEDAYDTQRPERGVMLAKDLGRPGIVVTREYTVETERRKQERRRSDWRPSDFWDKPARPE